MAAVFVSLSDSSDGRSDAPRQGDNSNTESPLSRYRAKRDAKEFVHLYNSAARILGKENLPSDSGLALDRFVSGIGGPGELVFRFKDLDESERRDLLAFVIEDSGGLRLKPCAGLTEAEQVIRSKELACQHKDCRRGCLKAKSLPVIAKRLR